MGVPPPDVWLRGPVPGIAPALMPVAHALLAAREEATRVVEGITAEQLWQRPGGAASIGFHLMHLAGATDRLLTYARGDTLTEIQQEQLRAEKTVPEPPPTTDELLRRWERVVDLALSQLAATTEAELPAPRTVGRARLPSTVLGLLFHAADHAQRHVGQLVTTAKIIRGM